MSQETVGFTNDGRIFLKVVIPGAGGHAKQVTLTWEPKDAVRVAKYLEEAADKCIAKVGGGRILLPGGARG